MHLAPFVGKTWKGEFSSSTPEKPVVDVSQWEVALGGEMVRILHSVNDGEYGGEWVAGHSATQVEDSKAEVRFQ